VEIGSVRTGDLVRCNVRGDRFLAYVREPVAYNTSVRKRVLTVTSATGRPIPSTWVSARQVIGIWRKTAKTPDPQEG
jgi:hypothetical protein